MNKLRERDSFAFGWNAQTGEYGNLYDMGVIDPEKWFEVRSKAPRPLQVCW